MLDCVIDCSVVGVVCILFANTLLTTDFVQIFGVYIFHVEIEVFVIDKYVPVMFPLLVLMLSIMICIVGLRMLSTTSTVIVQVIDSAEY